MTEVWNEQQDCAGGNEGKGLSKRCTIQVTWQRLGKGKEYVCSLVWLHDPYI